MISLLMPFASKDPQRLKIFWWVQSRWAHLFPEFQLCVGLNDENNFNRGAARNEAFRQAKGEIIVLADADNCCPAENVRDAIEAVRSGVPWVIAHEVYYSLTQEATEDLLNQPVTTSLEPPFKCDWYMRKRSIAGVLVMHREAWETVGGYNEDFRGWGFEDDAFAISLDDLWGKHERVPGPMLHLWHPRGEGSEVADFSQPHIGHNMALLEEIKRRCASR